MDLKPQPMPWYFLYSSQIKLLVFQVTKTQTIPATLFPLTAKFTQVAAQLALFI